MCNSDNEIFRLIYDFLEGSYPIMRLRDGKRFKRGIHINGRDFFLHKDSVTIFSLMYNILDLVYDIKSESISHILAKQYGLTS